MCSENKGADQLRGYREADCIRKADLHLCFHICKKPVFLRRGSYVTIELSHPYHSDESIGIRSIFFISFFDEINISYFDEIHESKQNSLRWELQMKCLSASN